MKEETRNMKQEYSYFVFRNSYFNRLKGDLDG